MCPMRLRLYASKVYFYLQDLMTQKTSVCANDEMGAVIPNNLQDPEIFFLSFQASISNQHSALLRV